MLVDGETEVGRGLVTSPGYSARERQGTLENPGSEFPTKFTFHSAAPLDWRKKDFEERKKKKPRNLCKTLLMCVPSSSGLESLELSMPRD